jgi:hypothetical protein
MPTGSNPWDSAIAIHHVRWVMKAGQVVVDKTKELSRN